MPSDLLAEFPIEETTQEAESLLSKFPVEEQQDTKSLLSKFPIEPTKLEDFPIEGELETNDEPRFGDYLRMIPALLPTIARAPSRLQDGIEELMPKSMQDEVAAAARAETIRDLARNTLATMGGAVPTDTGKRLAEDYLTEATRFVGAPIEQVGTLLETAGAETDIADFGRWISDTGSNPLDVFREKGHDFGEEHFGDELNQGIASTLGFMAVGAKAKAMNLSNRAIAGVVATLGAAVGGQGGRQEAEAFDATPEQIKAAYYFNSAFGLSEAAPIMKVFNRLDKATGGLLSHKIKSKVAKVGIAGIKGALEEGLQEGFQTIGGDIVAMESYDPTRSWNENLANAVQVGSSVGFLMNLLLVGVGVKNRAGVRRTLEKSLGDEALRLTGAKDLEEIAFNDEGIVEITTLSDDYLRAQKTLAKLTQLHEQFYEEAVASGVTDQNVPEAVLEAEAFHGEEIRNPNTSNAWGVRDNLTRDLRHFPLVEDRSGIHQPNFFSELGVTTEKPRKVYDPELKRSEETDSVAKQALFTNDPVISALTRQLRHDEGVRDRIKAEIDDSKDMLRRTRRGEFDSEEYQNEDRNVQEARAFREEVLTQSIADRTESLKIIQARISEARAISGAVNRLLKKALPLFPKGSRFLIHDWLGAASQGMGISGYSDNTGGAANIFQFKKGSKEVLMNGLYMNLTSIINARAEVEKAKLQGIEGAELQQLENQYRDTKDLMHVTLYHELGHLLAHNTYGELINKAYHGTATPGELKIVRSLQHDYMEWVNAGLRSPLRQFVARFLSHGSAHQQLQAWVLPRELLSQRVGGRSSYISMRDLDTSGYTEGINEILNRRKVLEQMTPDAIDYIFRFEEFLAEEIAIAAELGKVPGSRESDPYFRKNVRELRKLAAQRPGVRKMGSRTIGNYLQTLSTMGKLKAAIDEMADKKLDTINPLRPLIGKSKLMSPEVAIKRLEEVDVFNKFMDIGFNLLQIAEKNPWIQGLQEYVEHMRGWKNEVNGKLSIAQTTITEWEQLGKKEQELVGRILLDETVGVTYDGKTLKKPRDFTEAEVNQYGLSEEGLAVRQKVKADLREALNEMERVLKAKVSTMFASDPLRQTQELGKISKEFSNLRAKPYFPLMRFGEWTLVVRAKGNITVNGTSFKDGEIVDFQAFDTERERDAAARKQKALGQPVTVAESRMKQPNFSIQGMPLTMVEHLERTLGHTLSEEQKLMFDQVKKDVLPFKSFRKQYTRRRKIHGYSMDAIRSYANYMTSYANHIGRVKFDSKFQDALKNVERSISVMQRLGKNSDKRTMIYDYMNDHLEYVLNPVNEFTAIRSAAFFWFLGYNVKSAFVNATQIPLVTYPYLAAKYGDVKATKELVKANKTAIKALTKLDIDPELGEMIERGLKESWLDESLATELAMAASEKNLDKSLPRHWRQKAWQNISHYGALPFHTVEKFNRHVTAVAAYQLAKAEGRNHEEAILDARKAVEKTQFEYARWARPRFMRGKVGGTMFVFMNYMQNALYFALGGDPGAFRMWLMLFALAGLQGLPFGEDIMDLVDGAMTFAKRKLGMKDPWTDTRHELRKTLDEMGADPDLILHGLSSSTFGLANIGEFMGWPIPDLDLSASLSLGRITPGAQLLSPKVRDFDRFISEMSEGVGGAAVSGGLNFVKPWFDNNPDQWKRWEKAMPAAMRQVSKAARIKTKGEEATRAGYSIAALDWHDHQDRAELIAQGLGFTPRDISKGWEGYIAVQSAITYYETWKSSLLRDWNYYSMNKDAEGKKDVNNQIREYNRVVPHPALKIGPEAREQSAKTYYRQHAFNQHRIEQSARSRPYASSILKVYEEDENN